MIEKLHDFGRKVAGAREEATRRASCIRGIEQILENSFPTSDSNPVSTRLYRERLSEVLQRALKDMHACSGIGHT